MIIIDYSAISIAALMVQEGLDTTGLNESYLRHLVINSLRAIVRSHKNTYSSEVVIACDDGSKNYWRKEIFPQYKAYRKKPREDLKLDWDEVYASFAKFREELKEWLPYKVILVPRAEADDIVAVLAKDKAFDGSGIEDGGLGFASQRGSNAVLVVSGDSDFLQLQKYPGIRQYSNIKKEFLDIPDPEAFLKEKIIRGEPKNKDAIPNILCEDDFFASGQRSPPITAGRLDKYMAMSEEELLKTTYYDRNRKMIDFQYIPEDLQQKIRETYQSAVPKSRSKLLNYFVKYKLNHLVSYLGDF